jgi:hypothetical protein
MSECIDNLKLKEIKELLSIVGGSAAKTELPFKIGEKVFIRTVTHYLTGQIKDIVGKFLVLKDAAWIADSGRFTQAIEEGRLNEVEPVTSDVRVNTDSIVDCYQWAFELPRVQK